MSDVYRDIQKERERQDRKWGFQRHPSGMWQLILTEEVGEVAQAALAEEFDRNRIEKKRGEIRKELVQVAAVAVAWIEHLDDESERANQ